MIINNKELTKGQARELLDALILAREKLDDLADKYKEEAAEEIEAGELQNAIYKIEAAKRQTEQKEAVIKLIDQVARDYEPETYADIKEPK